jgi:putative Mg2+ transporter-C (MgtC) family protein
MWQTQVLRILLATGLGAVVGWQRQRSGKVAGVRTNVLICLGAAVLTMVSEHMGIRYGDSVSRVAAQIVTGVGFLGAGVIIRDRGGVHGLTTAATIGLVASVGMAAGAVLRSARCGRCGAVLHPMSPLVGVGGYFSLIFDRSAVGLGNFIRSFESRSTRTSETARLRNHFLLAGMTNHGALGVLHLLSTAS